MFALAKVVMSTNQIDYRAGWMKLVQYPCYAQAQLPWLIEVVLVVFLL